jgi:DNA-directed RNA polymerase I, II, and III subunit RPABC2
VTLKNSQHLIIYLLSFGAFLVAKDSSQRTSKKIRSKTVKRTQPTKKNTPERGTSVSAKKIAPEPEANSEYPKMQLEEQTLAKSTRPIEEIVTYDEPDFSLMEISSNGPQVLIGPTHITRFEKARITGTRSLQLSLGAPSFIVVPPRVRDSVSLATAELLSKSLPISIRRVLPNGLYQDIPIDWLK